MSHYTDSMHEKAPFSVRITNFACNECDRRWSSANGSLQDYQKCKYCYTKCYPLGHKIRAPNKTGNENRETYQGHIKELCGKCQRLGKSCMMLENDYDDSYRVITNADGEDMYLDRAFQLKASKTENMHVMERYELNEWPELASNSFQYVPKVRDQGRSSKFNAVSSSSEEITSVGITAAETLKEIIQKARRESNEMSNEEVDDEFIANHDYSNYVEEYDCNDVWGIWAYDSMASDQDDEWSCMDFSSRLNQDNDDGNELVGLFDDCDERGLEENGQYLSSQDQEAYFNDNLQRIENLHFADEEYIYFQIELSQTKVGALCMISEYYLYCVRSAV
ncbi:hypothetical protein BD408DRAFT_442920 [Parasitella parasitica]|nr:hypothetical protein BD408DRAFT_442920 [Parasitella parasitica]